MSNTIQNLFLITARVKNIGCIEKSCNGTGYPKLTLTKKVLNIISEMNVKLHVRETEIKMSFYS